MTAARPFKGPVMLRPISQLRPRPNNTATMPTAMMKFRVRVCEALSIVEAAFLRSAAD